MAAKVTLKLGDLVLETSNVTLISSNNTKDTIDYYTQLINDKGVVPSTTSRDERILEVTKMVINKNKNELQAHRSGSNVWKNNADQTIVGILRTNKQLGNNSALAIDNYDKIAHEMAKDKKILKSFLFIHPKRTAYMKIINDLSNTGKIK